MLANNYAKCRPPTVVVAAAVHALVTIKDLFVETHSCTSRKPGMIFLGGAKKHRNKTWLQREGAIVCEMTFLHNHNR